MKIRRVLAAALCTAVAVTSLAACSGSQSAGTESGSAQNGSTQESAGAADAESNGEKGDPTTISIAYWDVEKALAGGESDAVLQKIQEDTNTVLTPVNITWDDYRQKIQLWATQPGQLPDIFSIDVIGSSFYHNWTEQGVVAPLPEDLSPWPALEEYMSSPDIQALRKEDGRFYTIPRTTWGDIKQCAMERRVYYRWDLAQEAGVTKEPETYEEFRDMLRKIIAADPEGKSIAGMTVSIPQLLDSFFMPYSVPLGMGDGSGSDFKWVEQDGKYVPAYFAGDLKAAFQLARDMYEEGTIDPDIALAKNQLSEDKFLQGGVAAYFVNTQSDLLAKKWNEVNPDKKFEDCVRIAPPFPGMDGTTTCPVFKTYWSETYISAQAADKMDAILDLYNYLLENDELIRYGFEGEDWEEQDGVIIQKTADLAAKYPVTNMSGLVQNASWHRLELTGDPARDLYRQMDIDWWNMANEKCTVPEYEPSYTNISTPTQNEFIIKPAEDLMTIMTGTEPVDKMYEDLMESYEKAGLSKMIEEVNEVINSQK